ncbi:alpha-ketoacid dehydrogenase subunit beta [Candidatus Gottesmanbacteria bacterium]|nr:alpha-ketoacid dehydrogenase subunit beta [Candidatus Gottesmanbacteria bacterium]
MKKREITYAAAIREAFDIALARDERVFLVGEGIPDPKGAFGTTTGLQETYGPSRVMDMPVAENGMTGVVIGAALGGMRPVLTHMRVDFSLLSMDQIVNTAAKWYFMFGQKQSVPIVIRMIIGRGWGQGPQHSQSLQALFAHIPGLKVVMPASPRDAKGLLLGSIADPNPVIFIEHRWLHGLTGEVPKGRYTVPIGASRVAREGGDMTIVAASYMTIEALRAAEALKDEGVSAEVVDVRSIRPLDSASILKSVQKTHRLIVADTGWKSFGIGAEIVAMVAEAGVRLDKPPVRIALPDMPTPTSPFLARDYYPTSVDIVRDGLVMCGRGKQEAEKIVNAYTLTIQGNADQPDPTFTGPF